MKIKDHIQLAAFSNCHLDIDDAITEIHRSARIVRTNVEQQGLSTIFSFEALGCSNPGTAGFRGQSTN